MDSVLPLTLAALLVITTTLLCSSSAAPAGTAIGKENGKRPSVFTDDQIERLRALLAKLRAEHGEPPETSVVSHAGQESGKEQPKEEEKEEQEQQPTADNTGHNGHHSRALSAEDMRDKDVDIVEELRRLDKDDTAEILARALSKFKERSRNSGRRAGSQEKEEGEGEEGEEEEEVSSNSAGDDMGTSNNGEETQGSKINNKTSKHVDTTQLIEALIKEGLAEVDRDTDSKPPSLFHSEPRMLPRKRNKGPVKEPLDQQIERYLELMSHNNGRVEESQGSSEEELQREKGLQMIESRLMEDIHLANSLGVSVEDLIRDLEERAYIEANAQKIGELLDMHEQGRDQRHL